MPDRFISSNSDWSNRLILIGTIEYLSWDTLESSPLFCLQIFNNIEAQSFCSLQCGPGYVQQNNMILIWIFISTCEYRQNTHAHAHAHTTFFSNQFTRRGFFFTDHTFPPSSLFVYSIDPPIHPRSYHIDPNRARHRRRSSRLVNKKVFFFVSFFFWSITTWTMAVCVPLQPWRKQQQTFSILQFLIIIFSFRYCILFGFRLRDGNVALVSHAHALLFFLSSLLFHRDAKKFSSLLPVQFPAAVLCQLFLFYIIIGFYRKKQKQKVEKGSRGKVLKPFRRAGWLVCFFKSEFAEVLHSGMTSHLSNCICIEFDRNLIGPFSARIVHASIRWTKI